MVEKSEYRFVIEEDGTVEKEGKVTLTQRPRQGEYIKPNAEKLYRIEKVVHIYDKTGYTTLILEKVD